MRAWPKPLTEPSAPVIHHLWLCTHRALPRPLEQDNKLSWLECTGLGQCCPVGPRMSPQDVTPGCPCCPCPCLAPVLALPTQAAPRLIPTPVPRSSSFPIASPLYFWKQFGQETHRKLSLAELPPQTFPSCSGRGQGRDFPLPPWGLAAAKVNRGTRAARRLRVKPVASLGTGTTTTGALLGLGFNLLFPGPADQS